MAINPQTLLNWQFDTVTQTFTTRDAILYALGVGLGKDPLNKHELNFVYEQSLQTLPTFAVTLATLGLWVKNPDTGITWTKLVHSAQNAKFHRPLPSEASVYGKARISEVYDRGDKGAVIIVERSIYDAGDDQAYCTLEQTLMLRADGGFDGKAPPVNTINIPKTSADKTLDFTTSPGQAIIYRLSGDWNPLHIDPAAAESAGFSQPILHGYCSYGIAGWVASKALGKSPSDLSELSCQFSGIVMPGDMLAFEFWQESNNRWLFRAKVGERTVLNRGLAVFN